MTGNAYDLACMIQGNKPSGYGVTRDSRGRLVEVEFRQCSHCQHSWQYSPGSGITRGWCYHCNGLLCGRKECFKMTCAPFYDVAMEMSKKYVFNEQAGIFIKV